MRRLTLAFAVAILAAAPLPAAAADCARSTTGLVALTDLGAGTYKSAQGGLYPTGTNIAPEAYATAGRRAASEMVPRIASGQPDALGAIVLLSIGMSNTTQEFSRFVSIAKTDPARDRQVLVVDGAQGGQDARDWADPKAQTWIVAEARLRKAGATAAQVQAIWLKQATARPSGDFAASSAMLEAALVTIVENAKARYPNLVQVFLSPRTYAGYATTTLNPEPYAYESGFAVKRVVERSVRDPGARPWLGWGPYLWADGTKARADGLTWACADTQNDGVHPSPSGEEKVAQQLQAFFSGSEFTTWYRGTAAVVAPASTAQPAAATTGQPAGAVAGQPGEGTTGPLADAPWSGDLAALTIAGAAAIGAAATVTLLMSRRRA